MLTIAMCHVIVPDVLLLRPVSGCSDPSEMMMIRAVAENFDKTVTWPWHVAKRYWFKL
jgi:hypothetical protein